MEFAVVQCYSCGLFQSLQFRQTTKNPSRKFVCKICRAPQSVKKILLSTSCGKDARMFIQQKNLHRGEAAARSGFDATGECEEFHPQQTSSFNLDQPVFHPQQSLKRWEQFV
eukprot:TRINITY_DN11415_c0_g1_i2.p3 TRINITY_DN11415_c0_g1~~TRINITY_DN11415_c0_g1_i2.p3  ORF type:complete len:112 (+),score=20.40 TRINITY_DN11415_c0_g1_i2:93-428(+)